MPVSTRSAPSSAKAIDPSGEILRAFSKAQLPLAQTEPGPSSLDLHSRMPAEPAETKPLIPLEPATIIPEKQQGVVQADDESGSPLLSLYTNLQERLSQTEKALTHKLDAFVQELRSLQIQQRDLQIRDMSTETAIEATSSEVDSLTKRITTLETNPLIPPVRQGATKTAPIPSFPGTDPSMPPPVSVAQTLPFPLPSIEAHSQRAPIDRHTPLITTAPSSAPLPAGAKSPSSQTELGLYAPSLEPVQTMLPWFALVVDYRRYRLSDTTAAPHASEFRYLYKLKTQIDGLYPTPGIYEGLKPIALLGSLSTLKEAFEAYNTSEAIAVRTLAYFLAEDVKDVTSGFTCAWYTVYQAQVNPGALTGHQALEATWPYVINALIRRFFTDDNLQSAYDAVVRATQGPQEDEVKFAQRLSDASRECCHGFQPMELLNSYVCGLHEATRERVQDQVRRLPSKERARLVTARQIASAEAGALANQERPVWNALLATPDPKEPRNAN